MKMIRYGMWFIELLGVCICIMKFMPAEVKWVTEASANHNLEPLYAQKAQNEWKQQHTQVLEEVVASDQKNTLAVSYTPTEVTAAEKTDVQEQLNLAKEQVKEEVEQAVTEVVEEIETVEQQSEQAVKNIYKAEHPETAITEMSAKEARVSVANRTVEQGNAESSKSQSIRIGDIECSILTYAQEGGQVPIYTPYAYWWNTTSMAQHNYYLIDNSNTLGLGNKVLTMNVGDTAYIRGVRYVMVASKVVYPSEYASQAVDLHHDAYLQTCYGAYASEGMRLVYLDRP